MRDCICLQDCLNIHTSPATAGPVERYQSYGDNDRVATELQNAKEELASEMLYCDLLRLSL